MINKPFGITYDGNLCSINLRFKPEPFSKVKLNKLGNFFYSNSGYVIFRAVLHTKTEEYDMFLKEREEYNKIAATK